MSYKIFSNEEIINMDTNYRIQLINSLGGFKSICLIGTKNKEHQTNLGLFNSVFHVGSAPALYGFVCRPADRERHSLENILSTQSYTINQVHHDFYEKAHQASAKYPREVSEFKKVGLTEEFQESIWAPYVKESKIKFALELEETHKLVNKNTIVIGRVVHIVAEESLIDGKGFMQLSKSETITGSGCDAYYNTSFLDRKNYARP
jgi:flavin reductase (DIM6/NTAB) family NADH-FMN oxidoreductase RutF